MSKLEDLILRITADSSQLRRELGIVETRNASAASRITSSWKSATGTLSSFKTGLAGIASALAVRGIIGQVHQFLEFAESVNDSSVKLGIGVEALQEFRFAAAQSGIEAGKLEQAIAILAKKGSEAARGTGQAGAAFRELGLSLHGTDGQLRRTEDLFADTVNALSQVEKPADRVRLAFQLLGRGGVAITQLGDHLDDLRAQARELGAVVDKETIKRAEEAGDQLEALSMVINAQLGPAIVSLTPILIASAEAFARVAGWAGRAFDSFEDASNLGLQRTITQMGVVGAELKELDDKIKAAEKNVHQRRAIPIFKLEFDEKSKRFLELQEQFKKLSAQPDKAPAPAAPVGAFTPPSKAETKKAAKDASALAEIQAEIDALERLRAVRGNLAAEERVTIQIAAEVEARKSNLDLTTEQGKRFAALSLQLQTLEADSKLYTEAQRGVNSIIESGFTPADNLARSVEKLTRDYQAGLVSPEQFAAGHKAIEKQFVALAEKLDEEAKSFASVAQVMGDALVDNFSRSMAILLTTGELTFKALAQSFVQDFIAASINALITSSIARLGASAAGGATSVAGLALGGPVAAGQPYIVGERGPELIVPRAAGVVLPNSVAFGGGFGGGGGNGVAQPASVTVTVINETDGRASVSEQRGPSGTREIQVLISRAVSGEIAQGGPIARAMDGRYGQKPRGA